MYKFHKNWAHCNFDTKSAQMFNFGSRFATLNIIFMIKEIDLLWVSNFITLGIYFIFETEFPWNEGIDTWFNVGCVLLGRDFDFLGGYLVVTALYLVVTAGYCSLPGGYRWLLLVTCGYCSFRLLVWMEWHLCLNYTKNSYTFPKFFMKMVAVGVKKGWVGGDEDIFMSV